MEASHRALQVGPRLDRHCREGRVPVGGALLEGSGQGPSDGIPVLHPPAPPPPASPPHHGAQRYCGMRGWAEGRCTGQDTEWDRRTATGH